MWSDLWYRKCFALLSTEMLCDSLFCICFMWDFHEIFSSTITPRNLFSWTLIMSTPSTCISAWRLFLQFPNIMNLVLFRFNDNLFLSNHVFNLHISAVIIPKSPCKSPPDKKIFVSSANKTNFKTFDLWDRCRLYTEWTVLDRVLKPGGRHRQCARMRNNSLPTLQIVSSPLNNSSPSAKLSPWSHTVPVYWLIHHDWLCQKLSWGQWISQLRTVYDL